ncbi:MAG: class I SAM-dependent methyltransferase [Clostridiaceae bacterium]|jgi:SAM-dependent methyltransferase|nr:class I SAM-dependent methyltransferase [Clostridiaceae bacterium]
MGIINWQELMRAFMPPMPPPPKNGVANHWVTNDFADMYNKMAWLEKKLTLNQVGALPLRKSDTLLDSGCGPGRIAVPCAKRVKSVTALDINPFCLEYVLKNGAEEGLKNIKTVQKDWLETTPEEIGKFDVVICSRSAGLGDLQKLSSFSKRIAAIVTWGDGPNIPQIQGEIFKGCRNEEHAYRHGKMPGRTLGFNVFFNTVYDMGYQPNVSWVDDGFVQDFTTLENAYAFIKTLGKVDEDKEGVFKANLKPYLTENNNGTVTFAAYTQSIVMWWDVTKKY